MNDKSYTGFVQLFRPYCFLEPIEEDGYLVNGHFEINYSFILTKLIQEAGRYCERFASDLFIDWSGLDRQLNEGTLESKSILFGFRESGVDHTEYVYSRCINEGDYASHNYRSIWRLDIDVADGDYYVKNLKMTLYRVSVPASWTLKRFFESEKTAA